MLNISPLMEVCFLLFRTFLGALKTTRQVPWSTRRITQLEDCLCTRPCRQEELLTWSTFLSLTNIFLLWLIITMELTGWTLQSINGMESCLSTFRNCQQTQQATSPISRYLVKGISQWPTTMTEVTTLQSQLSTNGAAASLTDFKTYQLKVPWDVRR